MSLVVVVVYPDLLGTYGDGGNGVVLAQRALWRGIDAELVEATSDRPLPRGDVYCLGGGEDGPQLRAAQLLEADGTLLRAVEQEVPVLAVCAGYQIVGRTFPAADGRRLPGLGLLDVTTQKGTGSRAVGEILAEPFADMPPGGRGTPGPPSADARFEALPPLTGFENHGGLTTLGRGVRALARVVAGIGNGDGTEGARSGRVVGTYLHGPVLARNPALADLLLSWAVGGRLAPLDDAEESALRAERLAAATRRRGIRLFQRLGS